MRLGTPKADTLNQVIAVDATARRIAQDLMQVPAV
jgi:hypothetical protein